MDYVYTATETNDISLAHHGIKGQKWGIRRYQNADGSLTDEGYRHYGYGKRGLFAPNTKQSMRKGVKAGAKVGAGIGVGTTALAASMIGSSMPPILVAGFGAALIGSWTATGALEGLKIGTISGMIDTSKGRNFIESNPDLSAGMSEFKKREFAKQIAVQHV